MFTLDLTSGYFQIAMKPEDISKTAFITSNGCFAFKRMCFVISGAPSAFQKATITNLKPLRFKGGKLDISLYRLSDTGLKLMRRKFGILRRFPYLRNVRRWRHF